MERIILIIIIIITYRDPLSEQYVNGIKYKLESLPVSTITRYFHNCVCYYFLFFIIFLITFIFFLCFNFFLIISIFIFMFFHPIKSYLISLCLRHEQTWNGGENHIIFNLYRFNSILYIETSN